MRRPAAVLALLLLSAPAAMHAQDAAPPFTLSVSGGRLSLDARGASLQSVLDEIGDRTGVRVRFDDPGQQAQIGDETVTMTLEAVPVEEALRRLLRGRNFVLVSSPGRPAEARVYGRPAPGPAEAQPAASIPTAPPGEPVDRNGVAALRSDALGNADPAARARALEGLAASGDQRTTRDTALEVLEREVVPGLLGRAFEIVGVQDSRARQVLEGRAANDPAPAVREAARVLLQTQAN